MKYTAYQVCEMLHRSLRGEGRPRWKEIRRAKANLALPSSMSQPIHRRAIAGISLIPRTPKAIRRYVAWAFTGVTLNDLRNEAQHMSPAEQVEYGYRIAA